MSKPTRKQVRVGNRNMPRTNNVSSAPSKGPPSIQRGFTSDSNQDSDDDQPNELHNDSPIESDPEPELEPANEQINSPLESPDSPEASSIHSIGTPPPRELDMDMTQSVIVSKVPRYAQLSVGDPEKVSDGGSSYVSYLVTSQMYSDERPDRVRRRFSEFAKLYENLCVEFPSYAVPPLPDRWRLEYIAGDRFSSEFTTKRAVSLNRFLFRVSQHPELRRSRYFNHFLVVGGTVPRSRENDEFVSVNSNASSALDHLGDALMNAFAKAKHQSREMVDAKERSDRYQQNITTIDKAVARTSKMQAELATDFEEMQKHASKLAKLEPGSSGEFEALSAVCESFAKLSGDLRLQVDAQFACALRDMAHYVQALKGMLKQREQRQIDYEALVEYQRRSEHELVAATHGQPQPAFSSGYFKSKMNELRGMDKEQMRQQRISKLKARIGEFQQESSRAKQVSDAYEDIARREVKVFDQTEAIELQQSLTGLSDSYITYYTGVLKECRALESVLESI